jgi:C4-dicarboxylate-specific signal transduction histidine kinase
LEAYQQALTIQRELDDNESIPATLGNIGIIYNYVGDYQTAMKFFSESLAFYENQNDLDGIATSYSNIGVVYNNLGIYEDALSYNLKALEIKESIDNKEGIANSLNNLGLIYQKIDEPEKALEYYERALQIYESINYKEGTAATLGNLGVVFKDKREYSKALSYYELALENYESVNHRAGIANSLNHLGLIYKELKDFQKALRYCKQAYDIHQDIGSQKGIAVTANDIGSIFIELKNFSEAEKFLDEALHTSQKIHARMLIKNSYDSLAELYLAKRDFEKAFQYFKNFSVIKDSIYTRESNEQLAEIRTKYEIEKKEKENEMFKLEIEQQKWVKQRLYFLVFFIIAVFFIFFYFYFLKQKANKLLKQKINEALEKQKEQQQIIFHQANLTSLGEWAASIAHEVNQPLQNIMLSTENIDMDLCGEISAKSECKTAIHEIYDDIARIQRIIDHIRIFSSSQKSEIYEEFDVNHVVESALAMIRQKYSNLNIQIRLDLGENLPNLLGNSYKYEQVVLNLLSNARDAIEENPNSEKTVSIKTYAQNNAVVLSIRDTGIGMDKEVSKKILQPFFTTKELGKGTGLGLSISQTIISEMNGTITFESEKYAGTTVFVSIPLKKRRG